MVKKAVPEIFLAQRVISPIRLLAVQEDNARFFKFIVGLIPDVIVFVNFVFRMVRVAGCLEPGMLVGSMIGHQFHQDLELALMCLRNQFTEVFHITVHGVDAGVIADIIAIITQRGR